MDIEMRRLAIALAVLVGGLTAVPGTASAWEIRDAGSANNGWVTGDEAVYLTAVWTKALHYHGGVLRTNVLRADPYEGGPGSPFRDVELGVRFRDGTLGKSWSEAYYVGLAHPYLFRYALTVYR